MKTYQVGPDVPYDLPDQDERYIWMVYWYEEGCYDGQGSAVCLGTDGMLYEYDLGHCSCYGPCDALGSNVRGRAVQEYLENAGKPFELDQDEVVEKVKELLGVV